MMHTIKQDRPSQVLWVASFFGKIFLLLFLVFFLVISFPQNISLTTADLGRHIKNGEIFFQSFHPTTTNFYSYTQPDYPMVNHHWLTGVIFYLIFKYSSFEGLGIFYTVIFLFTFGIFFKEGERKSNFFVVFLIAVLSIPLIVSRREIRPEGLSCLFLGIYYYLLYGFKEGKIKRIWLFGIIPFLQILWVNLHILFFTGLILIGAFFLDAWFTKQKGLSKNFLLLGVVVLFFCFLNPFGLKGVLTPLTIFKEYGYMLAENQSVFFMQKRFPENPLYVHFEGVFLLGVASFVVVIWQHGIRKNFLALILFGFFSLLAWKSVRSIQMAGFFFIPILSNNIYVIAQNFGPKLRPFFYKLILLCSVVILIAGYVSKNFYYSFYNKLYAQLGLTDHSSSRHWLGVLMQNPKQIFGLITDINRSAEFFKRLHLEGPIFNNYDIGGYLIYHLFPKERVFVDNRPEGYSVSFFKDTYVPMQENESIWEKMLELYQFNAIYFFRRDMTPWAQPFLIRRIQDPAWAPVFVDGDTIILLRRNEKNAAVIREHELPQNLFKVQN